MDFLAEAAALLQLAAVAAEQGQDQGQNAGAGQNVGAAHVGQDPVEYYDFEDDEHQDDQDDQEFDPSVTVEGDHDMSPHPMIRRSQVHQAHPLQVPQQHPPPPQAVVQDPQEPGAAVGILPPLVFPNHTRRRQRGHRRRREQIAVLLQLPVLHLPPLPQAAVEDHQEPGAAVGILPPLGFPNHTRRKRGPRRRREQIAVLLQLPALHLPPLPQPAVEDHQEPGAAVGILPPLGFPIHTRRRRGSRRRRQQMAVLLQHPVLHLPEN